MKIAKPANWQALLFMVASSGIRVFNLRYDLQFLKRIPW